MRPAPRPVRSALAVLTALSLAACSGSSAGGAGEVPVRPTATDTGTGS